MSVLTGLAYTAGTTLPAGVVEIGRAAVRASASVSRRGADAGPACVRGCSGSGFSLTSGGDGLLGLNGGALPPEAGALGDVLGDG
jgi:hypothetical protein